MDADPVEAVRARLMREISGNGVSLARYLHIVGEVASETGVDRDALAEEVRMALGGSFAIHAAPAS